MAPQIEKVTESLVLGEGPHWDVQRQTLFFVDLLGSKLVSYTPATNKFVKASVAPKIPTFIIPVAGRKDLFVVSLDAELVIISWDCESDKISIVETLGAVNNTPETKDNKFNDGKCDPSGRLWAGTHAANEKELSKTLPLGFLYSFDSKTKLLKSHVGKIKLANGLAFNEQAKKMYYIDSLKGTVDQYDFDVSSGTVSNGQALFTLSKHNIPGIPDGMTIDTDGNLWVANFPGGRVLKIDGRKPETLLETISMPTPQVTSVAFGGTGLNELYVTTGSIEFEGVKVDPPVNGATYRITGTGSRGFRGVSFKI